MANRKPANPYWINFFKHFPLDGDLLQQVLRGHLLVEAVLRELFEQNIKKPDVLKGSSGTRFDCHQIICLNEALTENHENLGWVWHSAKKLNQLRNDLTHNIPSESLSHKVNNFIKVTQDAVHSQYRLPSYNLDAEHPLLYDSIQVLYVAVISLKEKQNH